MPVNDTYEYSFCSSLHRKVILETLISILSHFYFTMLAFYYISAFLIFWFQIYYAIFRREKWQEIDGAKITRVHVFDSEKEQREPAVAIPSGEIIGLGIITESSKFIIFNLLFFHSAFDFFLWAISHVENPRFEGFLSCLIS